MPTATTNIYNFKNTIVNDTHIEALIELNPKHAIFKGHFPDQPILPGVIQIQMVKELLELGLEKEMVMKRIGRCKFLQVIDPRKDQIIQLQLELSHEVHNYKIIAKGISIDGLQTFFKFTGEYIQTK